MSSFVRGSFKKFQDSSRKKGIAERFFVEITLPLFMKLEKSELVFLIL